MFVIFSSSDFHCETEFNQLGFYRNCCRPDGLLFFADCFRLVLSLFLVRLLHFVSSSRFDTLRRSAKARVKRERRKQAQKESEYQTIDQSSNCSITPLSLVVKSSDISPTNLDTSEISRGNSQERSNTHSQPSQSSIGKRQGSQSNRIEPLKQTTQKYDDFGIQLDDSMPYHGLSSNEFTPRTPVTETATIVSIHQRPQTSNSLEPGENDVSAAAKGTVTVVAAPSMKQRQALNKDPTKKSNESTVHVTRIYN